MASSINPSNINGNYPIAGQDNDSQGFRDNFTNIRTNLTYAQQEINDLQNKAVLKAPLNGSTSTTVTNNLAGVTLSGAITTEFVSTAEIGSDAVTGNVDVEFTNGSLHKLGTAGNITFTLGWGAVIDGQHATQRMWINVNNANHLLTFTAPVNGFVGFGKLGTVTNYTLTPVVGQYLIEFGTVDSGSTVYVVPLITP